MTFKTKFSHLDEQGSAKMVHVGMKPVQQRQAVAQGELHCAPATIRALKQRALPKGDVLVVAQIAGVQAVKQTAQLIPLCHPLHMDHIQVSFEVKSRLIQITCRVSTSARTGAEMEALTGVTVAALTLYDMCKAVDKKMSIENVRVTQKIKK